MTEFTTTLYRYWDLYTPMILQGIWMTIMISVAAMALSVVLAYVLGIARFYGNKWVKRICNIWVDFLRGVPILILMFFIYYGLPNIGIQLPPFLAGTVALALNFSAFQSETVLTAFLSIPKGQFDAANALSISKKDTFRVIILPQINKFIRPLFLNDFISMLKDSSLVSVISMTELTRVYSLIAQKNFDYLGLGLIIALIYWGLSMLAQAVGRQNWNEVVNRRQKISQAIQRAFTSKPTKGTEVRVFVPENAAIPSIQQFCTKSLSDSFMHHRLHPIAKLVEEMMVIYTKGYKVPPTQLSVTVSFDPETVEIIFEDNGIAPEKTAEDDNLNMTDRKAMMAELAVLRICDENEAVKFEESNVNKFFFYNYED